MYGSFVCCLVIIAGCGTGTTSATRRSLTRCTCRHLGHAGHLSRASPRHALHARHHALLIRGWLTCACPCAAITHSTRRRSGPVWDTSLAQALDMPCTPDILLYPSDLAPFAKLVPCGGAPDQGASAAVPQNTVLHQPRPPGQRQKWRNLRMAAGVPLNGRCDLLHTGDLMHPSTAASNQVPQRLSAKI